MYQKNRKKARGRNSYVQSGEEEPERAGLRVSTLVSTGRSQCKRWRAAVKRQHGERAQLQCHVLRAAFLGLSVHLSIFPLWGWRVSRLFDLFYKFICAHFAC